MPPRRPDGHWRSLWTLVGTPRRRTAGGLRMGPQMIGAPGDEARLLRTARWLEERLVQR